MSFLHACRCGGAAFKTIQHYLLIKHYFRTVVMQSQSPHLVLQQNGVQPFEYGWKWVVTGWMKSTAAPPGVIKPPRENGSTDSMSPKPCYNESGREETFCPDTRRTWKASPSERTSEVLRVSRNVDNQTILHTGDVYAAVISIFSFFLDKQILIPCFCPRLGTHQRILKPSAI